MKLASLSTQTPNRHTQKWHSLEKSDHFAIFVRKSAHQPIHREALLLVEWVEAATVPVARTARALAVSAAAGPRRQVSGAGGELRSRRRQVDRQGSRSLLAKPLPRVEVRTEARAASTLAVAGASLELGQVTTAGRDGGKDGENGCGQDRGWDNGQRGNGNGHGHGNGNGDGDGDGGGNRVGCGNQCGSRDGDRDGDGDGGRHRNWVRNAHHCRSRDGDGVGNRNDLRSGNGDRVGDRDNLRSGDNVGDGVGHWHNRWNRDGDRNRDWVGDGVRNGVGNGVGDGVGDGVDNGKRRKGRE